MRLHSVFPLPAILVLAVISGCGKQEEPKAAPSTAAMGEGKTVFEQKCGTCHGLDRATSRTETKEKWNAIVKEMQGKKADWISDQDAAKIVDHLASAHGK